VTAKRAKFEYDDSNRLTNLYRYQNSTESNLVAKAAYGRDSSGRLTSLTYTDATPIDLAKYQWTYDAADRISQMKTSRDAASGDWGVADYIYDARGQLTDTQYTNYAGTMPTEDYNYDGNGNRTNTGYATGDDNRMTSSPNPGSGTYTYSYDDQGNRTARWIAVNDNKVFDGTDSDGSVYAWDAGGRLTSVTHYAVAEGSADWKVSYYYDLQNRLVGRDLDPDANEATDNTQRQRFVYDGDQVVLEFDKTGSGDITNANLSHRYLWGVAVDQLLADENLGTPGVVDWTLGDHINSVRDVATYGSGTTTLADHLAYDAFGNVKIHAAAVDLLFQFTGRMHDEKTGLQNNLNRWYDAAVGKWLSEDPSGFEAGDANLYRYCGNGPTNGVDPRGLADWLFGQDPNSAEYQYSHPNPLLARPTPHSPSSVAATVSTTAKMVQISQEDANKVVTAYLAYYRDLAVTNNGQWLQRPTDADRFMHIMNLTHQSDKLGAMGDFGEMMIFNSLSALGSSEYKFGVGAVQSLMAWANNQYNAETGVDEIAKQLKKVLLSRIGKLQEEHIGQVVPEEIQGYFDKLADTAKEKAVDAFVDQVKQAVLMEKGGKTVRINYPKTVLAGKGGGGQQAGETVQCTFVVTKDSNGTYCIMTTGTYTNIASDFESYYKTPNTAFGAGGRFTAIQYFKLVGGNAELGSAQLKLKYTQTK